MYRLIPSFIAKKDIESIAIIGRIARLIGSVFLDRENEKDRKNAVIKININHKLIIYFNLTFLFLSLRQ